MQIGVLVDLHVCNAKSECLEKYLLLFFLRERVSFLSFHWLSVAILLIPENSPFIIMHYARRNIITLFTGKELHPASYFIGTEGSFTAVKRPGREAYHSSSFEVKNE